MITREQQADLYPGDTLELKFNQDGAALTLRGVFPEITNFYDNYLGGPYTLTVVSRAPRPLYVNHPRNASVPGDVVRDADNDWDRRTWMFHNNGKGPCWLRVVAPKNGSPIIDARERREHLPPHLRLLVDGETGQAVQ